MRSQVPFLDFFCHRAFAAFRALALRCAFVILAARFFPPFAPADFKCSIQSVNEVNRVPFLATTKG